MAASAWGVNSPEAVKLWSRKLFHEIIAGGFFGKFVGTGSNSLFQYKTETNKGPGDRVRVTLRRLLSGDGQQGDGTLEGNEEALATFTDDLTINQLRHAVRSAGKMSEQRVPFSVREEARSGLQDWWSERTEVSAANQLTGNTAQADTRYTGNQAALAPTSASSVTRIIVGGGHGGEGSLSNSTSHAIQLTDLDKAVAYSKSQRPRIRPVKVNGKNRFVSFLHPYQIFRLRQDTSSAGNFFDLTQSMIEGGKIESNPLLTGSEFTYNGCIVHEWDYLPIIVGAPAAGARTDYRRGVFCGAQSMLFGVGQDSAPQKMTWVEDFFDYENQLGVAAGMIFGMKKTQFDSIDFGTIVLSGYAPTP